MFRTSMIKVFSVWAALMLTAVAQEASPTSVPSASAAPVVENLSAVVEAKKMNVLVVPVREAIDEPVLYILRRGLKEARERKIDVVVLDMKTPGGSGKVAFDMMEALEKFPGKTITLVNNEAMSAGAFIAAATEEIWFAPNGIIGSAAAVTAEGADIPETMRLKINSFLRAKIRAISEGKGYRGEVISAMIDKDYELKIGDKVIKSKGELLALTATEASKTYGEPPQALLAAGIAKDVGELLTKKYGASGYRVTELKVTWSEELAQYLNLIKPALLGLGLLALFIEFKTPGFGVFGVAGIVLLVIVFLSSYAAGLSGHEPLVLFGVGVLLIAIELFFLPGVVVMALAGLCAILAALVWSMADLWPNEPISIAWSGDAFARPMLNLGLGVLVAVVGAVVLLRYLPSGWVWDRLVVTATIGGAAQVAGGAAEAGERIASLIGRTGVAVSALRPSGQIEIDGGRYEAKVDVGSVEAGARVVVRGRADFSLIVEEVRA